MKIFDNEFFSGIVSQAKSNVRLRQHLNIHESYHDSCQRFFNAIEPGSYIRPHRHFTNFRDELLVAIAGMMALVTFDDGGDVTNVIFLAPDVLVDGFKKAIEIPPSVWHTVVALEQGSVLLEIKAGPFDPDQPKDFAPWAPVERDSSSKSYLEGLMNLIISKKGGK